MSSFFHPSLTFFFSMPSSSLFLCHPTFFLFHLTSSFFHLSSSFSFFSILITLHLSIRFFLCLPPLHSSFIPLSSFSPYSIFLSSCFFFHFHLLPSSFIILFILFHPFLSTFPPPFTPSPCPHTHTWASGSSSCQAPQGWGCPRGR